MSRRRRYKPVLATQYSAFPAIIVIQEEDDGRQTIVPIPVNGSILLRWLWLWVQGLLPSFKISGPDFGLQRKVRGLTDELTTRLEQLRLSFQFGTVLARSLAWGVLGV
jgi:hypothetical protein